MQQGMSRNQTKGTKTRLVIAGAVAIFIAVLVFACQSQTKEYKTPAEVLTAQSTMASAWDELWGNDFNGAQRDFLQAASVLKSSAEAYRGQGLALFALGDIFEAANALVTSITLDPLDPASAAAHRFIDLNIPYKKDIADRLFNLDLSIALQYPDSAIAHIAQKDIAEYSRDNLADFKTFQAAAGSLRYVSGWSVLGPFPNGSGQSFDHEVINEKATIATPLPIDGSMKRWIRIAYEDPNGRVAIGERLSPSSNAVMYAQASFVTPKAGTYRIILDAAGAVKLWIDGDQSFVDRTYSRGNNKGWLELDLKAGSHKVLLKIGERSGNAWFRVSAYQIDPKRETIPPQLRKQALAMIDGIPDEERDPVSAVLALRLRNEGRVEDAFWLGCQLLDIGENEGLERELYGVSVTSPKKLAILGKIPENASYKDWLVSWIHSEHQRPDDARNTFVRSIDAGSKFAPAYDFLINEAEGDSRVNEMGRLISKSVIDTSQRFNSSIAKYRLDLLEKKDSDAEKELRNINVLWPGTSAAYFLKLDKNKAGLAAEDVTALSALGQKFQSMAVALELADKSNDVKNAFKYASLLQQLVPDNQTFIKDEIDFGLSSGSYQLDSFYKSLQTFSEQYPESFGVTDWVLSRAHNIWSFLDKVQSDSKGQKLPASFADLLRNFDRLRQDMADRELGMRPENFALRSELSSWKNDKDPNALAEVTDPLTILTGHLTAVAKHTTVNADSSPTGFLNKPIPVENDAQIFNEETVEMHFEDGGYHAIYSLLMRVNTTKGVRQESTQVVPQKAFAYSYTVLTAYVVKPDGSRVRAKDGNWSINFPGLAVGDFIVLVYDMDGARTGTLSPYLWSAFTLNDRYPVLRRSYNLYYPDSHPLKVAKHHVDEGTLKENDSYFGTGTRHYSVEVENLKALNWNSSLSSGKDLYSWIDLSTVPDWNTIANWYSDIAYGRMEPSPAIRQKVSELTAGLTDKNAIIQKLFAYAAASVAYENLDFQYSAYVPQWAESVMSDGFGDCKDKCTLLISLLAAAGIDAQIALSEPDYAGREYYLPSPRFSHVITFVGTGADRIILDPTDDLLTFPNLPAVLSGTSYLLVPRTGGSPVALEQLPSVKSQKSEIVIKMAPDRKNWFVQGNMVLRGEHAAYLRSIAESKDPAIQRRDVVAILDGLLPGISLTSYTLDSSDDLDYSPVLSFEATLDGGQGGQDTRLSFTPVWFAPLPSELSTRIALKGNGSPFEMRYPALDTAIKQTWIIGLPDGYRMSQPVSQDAYFGDSYVVHKSRIEGKTLIHERESFVPSGLVAAEDVDAYTAFLRQAAKADSQPDIFEKQ